MAHHTDFGKKGEDLAVAWLIQKGYSILYRNWRHGRYEVDIVARYQGACHFIEVKTSKGTLYGYPEERVNKKKIRNLMQAGVAWLHHFPGSKRVQYNVLSITLPDDADPEYFFIEDVYL
jgi:putative endonuclease